MNKKTIDNYIEESKTDIYVSILAAAILFFLLLTISFKLEHYYILIILILPVLGIFTKIEIYKRIIRVKEYLINNNLLEKIGKIDYWNNKNYFLTENYMIFITTKTVDIFSYKDIKEIKKEINYNKINAKNPSLPEDYLYITLKDNKKYRIVIHRGGYLINEDVKDITNYLLNKNKSIKEKETRIKTR